MVGLETIEPAYFGKCMCSIKYFKEAKVYSNTAHNKRTLGETSATSREAKLKNEEYCSTKLWPKILYF